MIREENRKAERTWQKTQHMTVQRLLEYASLENKCRKQLNKMNYQHNQTLVSIFEVHDTFDRRCYVHETIVFKKFRRPNEN